MPHMCVGGLGQHCFRQWLGAEQTQVIGRINAYLLSNGLLRTIFSENWIEILRFSFQNLKHSSIWKCRLLIGGHFFQRRGGEVKMKPLPGIRPTVEIQNTFQLLQLISLIPIRLLFGLTYRGWDKMAAISQTNLSNAFSWMKLLEFLLKFNWNLFPRVQFTTFRHWFW